MRDINGTSRGNDMARNRRTHYYQQLGRLDKDRTIKRLVVCYVVWQGYMIYGSLDQRRVVGLVPCCGQDCYQAQVPQQSIDTR